MTFAASPSCCRSVGREEGFLFLLLLVPVWRGGRGEVAGRSFSSTSPSRGEVTSPSRGEVSGRRRSLFRSRHPTFSTHPSTVSHASADSTAVCPNPLSA